MAILASQPPRNLAKIVRGIIDRFGEEDAATPSRQQLRTQLEEWARRLEGASPVELETRTQTRAVVLRALDDADELIRTTGPTSAVDRIHTALHGHLLALCEAAGIELGNEPTSTQALKALRRAHPALQPSGPRADDITRVLNAMASVLDSLKPDPQQRQRRSPHRSPPRRARGASGDQRWAHGLRLHRPQASRQSG